MESKFIKNGITYLPWDSKFFGYQVGKIVVEEDFLLPELKNYRLIYVFSSHPIPDLSSDLFDQKLVFVKELARVDDVIKDKDILITEFNYQKYSYKQLLNLALESGVHSRFNIDPGFRNQEFERLYKTWIDQSITGNNAIKVFIAVAPLGIIAGFITLTKKTDELADIGLIAVGKEFRGRGIASALLDKAANEAFCLGFKNIQVVTQKDNIPACKLYQGYGFKAKNLTYIYHIWNHDPI